MTNCEYLIPGKLISYCANNNEGCSYMNPTVMMTTREGELRLYQEHPMCDKYSQLFQKDMPIFRVAVNNTMPKENGLEKKVMH